MLKRQLETLQGQNNSGKQPQFKKKEGETAFIWDQGPSIRPKFQNHPTYSSPYPYYQNSRPVYHPTVNHPQSRPNYTIVPTPPFPISQPNLQTQPRPQYHLNPVPPHNQTYNYAQSLEIQNQYLYQIFTNLGRPRDQLYEQLKTTSKIGVVSPKTYLGGIPAGYDPQVTYAYDSESPSHSTINY